MGASEITSEAPFLIKSLSLGDCVIIMMRERFRRNRQSGSPALECGHLRSWVISLSWK